MTATITSYLQAELVSPLLADGSTASGGFDPREEAGALLKRLGIPAKVAHNAVNAADAMALKRPPSNRRRAR